VSKTFCFPLLILSLLFGSMDASGNIKPARSIELPLVFEKNEGQVVSDVQYVATSTAYSVALSGDFATLGIPDGKDRACSVRLEFLGGHAKKLAAENPLPGFSNYYTGSDPKQWITHVPQFGRVRYHDLYSGIDLVYYGNGQKLEYDLVVSPGADAGEVNLKFGNASRTAVAADGSLEVQCGTATLHWEPALAYQESSSGREPVRAEYVVTGDTVHFRLGAYDRTRALIIDPVVVFSTYYGSGSTDVATTIAVDSEMNSYVGGYSQMPSAPNATYAFVLKIDPTGTKLLYKTYLAQNARWSLDFTRANGIAVDNSGNAYVGGTTNSLSFPTVNAFQPRLDGGFLFASGDNGATWSSSDTGVNFPRINSIVVDPTNPATVYATAIREFLNSVYPIAGTILKSTDGGAHWATITNGIGPSTMVDPGGTPGTIIGNLAIDPHTPTTLYVGTMEGVYKSTDAGASWQLHNAINNPDFASQNTASGAYWVAVDPTNSSNIWAGGPWVYRSTDGGMTWSIQPTAYPVVSSILVGPTGLVYIGFSDQNNAAWGSITTLFGTQPVSDNPPDPGTGAVSGFAIDPENTAIVYAAGSNGVFKTTDAGRTWAAASNGLNSASVRSITFNHGALLAGTDRGLFQSNDGAATWTQIGTGLTNWNIVALANTGTQLLAGTDATANDGFVTELDGSGNLVYSTFLGGSGGSGVSGVAVNAGSAYLVGSAGSFNFPTTANALQPTFQPTSLIASPYAAGLPPATFVMALDGNGQIAYSTYFAQTTANAIAVDSAGAAYIAGSACGGLPVVNALQANCAGGGSDAFVTKFNPNWSVAFSTYFGGSAWDTANAIAVDGSGNIYLTGATSSSDFPTQSAFQPALGQPANAWVAELNPAGTAINFSTYLGGTSDPSLYNGDGGQGIAVDSLGYVYVTGYTGAANFPTTPDAVQPSFTGGGCYSVDGTSWCDNEAFLTIFNPGGTGSFYSSYIAGGTSGYAVAVDFAGDAFVAGSTSAPDFPTTPGAVQTQFGGGEYGLGGYPPDAFVMRMSGRPDFSLTASPVTATANNGQGVFTITVTPANGFNQVATLGCTGLPAGTVCNFSTTSVDLSQGPQTVALTVSPQTQTSARTSKRTQQLAFLMMPLLGVFFMKQLRRLWWVVIVLIVTALLLTLVGCGQGSSASTTTQSSAPASQPATPTNQPTIPGSPTNSGQPSNGGPALPSNYSFSVVATAGATQHTFVLSVTQ